MERLSNQRHDRIETPERVNLELDLAGIGSRGLACLLDTLFLLAGAVMLGVIGLMLFAAAGTLGLVVLGLGWFLLYWGYYAAFEALRDGRTPGKQIMGLRVQKVGGYAIGWIEALVRNLIRIVDSFLAVGIVVMLITRRHQRLGDLAAGTVVVRERAGGLERLDRLGYDAVGDGRANASGLTVEEFEVLHDLLVRRGEIHPQARARVERDTAAALRANLTRRGALPTSLAGMDDEPLLLHLDAIYRGEPIVRSVEPSERET